MLSARGGVALVAVALLFGGDLYSLFSEEASRKQGAPARTAQGGEAAIDRLSVGGKVHISFCSSWSYKGAFMQVQNLISREFPGVEVVPSHYPVAPANLALGKLAGYTQMGLLALTFAGDKIFPWLGMEPPEFYASVQQNKFGYAMAVWFIGNAVHNSLMSTGAFEIFHDGDLVFSKLALNRMPTGPEIMEFMTRKPVRAAAGEIDYS